MGYVLPVFRKLGVRIVRSIFRFCSKRSDLFIAPTEKVKRLLESYPVYCPLCVVPTGIKLTSFEKSFSDEEKRKIRDSVNPGKRRMLLYVGRLGKEKNVTELLLYISHIKRDDISLVIVGDGPYRTELEREAEELGLERPKVIFVGMVSPDEVYRWYRSADIFLNASLSETQGLTYIEALSSSLPLLVRKDECLDGVVCDGVNGWMYSTEEEFGSRLVDYLSLSDTSSLRDNAVKTAHEFSSLRFADRIENVYTEETEKRKRNET